MRELRKGAQNSPEKHNFFEVEKNAFFSHFCLRSCFQNTCVTFIHLSMGIKHLIMYITLTASLSIPT